MENIYNFISLGIKFDIIYTCTFTESVRITDSNKDFPDFSSAVKVNNSTHQVSSLPKALRYFTYYKGSYLSVVK